MKSGILSAITTCDVKIVLFFCLCHRGPGLICIGQIPILYIFLNWLSRDLRSALQLPHSYTSFLPLLWLKFTWPTLATTFCERKRRDLHETLKPLYANFFMCVASSYSMHHSLIQCRCYCVIAFAKSFLCSTVDNEVRNFETKNPWTQPTTDDVYSKKDPIVGSWNVLKVQSRACCLPCWTAGCWVRYVVLNQYLVCNDWYCSYS